jgi:predicted Zn-dependent protease with MMP-like domain
VKDTVWHELAHHLGLDEHEVRAAERRRHGHRRHGTLGT